MQPDRGAIRSLLRQPPVRRSLFLIGALVCIGACADFLANDKPLYCRIDDKVYFPVLREYAFQLGLSPYDTLFAPGRTHHFDAVIYAPVPFSATSSDLSHYYKSPCESGTAGSGSRHWLGTHDNGQDVAAGLIAGTRTALLVGLLSTLIAGLLGIFFGSIAGFWGDDRLRISRIRLFLYSTGSLAVVFYTGISPGLKHMLWPGHPGISGLVIALLILTCCHILAIFLEKIPVMGRRIVIPADLLIMRLIEVKNALPALLLLLVAVAWIEKPSVFYVIAIIGVLESSLIARLVRGELLRVRSLAYVEAARAMGLSERRVLWRHALPNALSPVWVVLSFSVAGAIVLESSISFMGIGQYATAVTWGSLLAQANAHRWWLALFPGLMIFITVLSFHSLGESLVSRRSPAA